MKATFTMFCITASFALMLAFAPANHADEAKLPATPEEFAKAMAEAGAPGSEHAKLKPLVGSWTYTCKAWMDPSAPPVETKGTIERKLILGGRFLEEKYAGTGFDGESGFEGLNLIGYDNAQKKYTSTFACSMGTGTCTGLGESDKSGKTFSFATECYCPLLKKNIKGRDEIRIESTNKVVVESYKIEDGAETKMMEIVSVRKK